MESPEDEGDLGSSHVGTFILSKIRSCPVCASGGLEPGLHSKFRRQRVYCSSSINAQGPFWDILTNYFDPDLASKYSVIGDPRSFKPKQNPPDKTDPADSGQKGSLYHRIISDVPTLSIGALSPEICARNPAIV